MLRLLTAPIAAIAVFLMAGCAPALSVSSHVRPGIDFSGYRTYEWGPADALPTGDARLDKNPYFQDHFEGAVEKQLARKGLERADGLPDILIHYHATITQQIDVNSLDRDYGYCYGDECFVDVFEYEAGTLVLDMIDARTNRLVWRGWAQSNIESVLENRERLARHVEAAVQRMLTQFPRVPS